MIKTHKRKKSSRYHGRKMGTCGTGARKNKRDSGNKGGKGMAGSGKRADHKKTLITKKYGNSYFGKGGITRGNNKRDKRKRIDIQKIISNLESFGKKTPKGWEIELKEYKILGSKEIKEKLIIKAKSASKSAIEKIEKVGGKIIIPKKEQLSQKIEEKEEK